MSATEAVDERDDQFRELVHSLLAFSARHEKIRAGHARAIGLRGAQYTVLIAIAHLDYGEGVSTRDVANHLSVTPTFVTMETSKLAGTGLVDKWRNPDDERATQLAVTEAGFDLLDQLAPLQSRCNDEEFAGLSTHDFHELRRLVRLLLDNSERAIALQKYLLANRVSPA